MENEKIIAILGVKNEEEIIGDNLRALSEFIDEIIIKDDASTDNTLKIIKQYPKVTKIWKKKPSVRTEVNDLNYLTKLALKREATWIMFVDADEIFEPKMKFRIKELIKQADAEGIGMFRFRKPWLWKSKIYYRSDKPEKFFSYVPYRLFRANKKIKWLHPTPLLFVRLIKALLGIQKLKPQYGFGGIKGITGSVFDVPDIIMLHYATIDEEKFIKKQILYAVNEKLFHPKKDEEKIINWAFDILDETNIKIKPINPEWLWPWQKEQITSLQQISSRKKANH